MKKLLLLLVPFAALLSFIPYNNSDSLGILQSSPADSTKLVPKPHYSEEVKLVTEILGTYHFRKIQLNDSLSSVILDEYIATLDNNKSYFLKSDIEGFEQYRYKIDEFSRQGMLDHAYDIYDVFRLRFAERMAYIQDTLLYYEFDYTLDESYNTDRKDMAWASSRTELNDQWRKMIKSQELSLKLNGKEQEGIQETIKKRYDRFAKAISQYTSEDVFELYLNTVSEAFDPHTNYFSPRTSDRFQQNISLSLEGIGARLQLDNDYTKVVQVLPGGPAEKSGLIHEDDKIVGVAQGEDGEMIDVIGWRIDDVVQLIKGPKGTVVRLEILPAESGINGPSNTIQLVREKIKLEDQQAEAKVIPITQGGRDYKVGVVTLPSFYMDFEAYQNGDPNYNSTTRDVRKLVEELKTQGIDGLMVDLRNNGGGSLSEAIDLTGLFIKDGPVVQVKTSANKIEVGEDENPELVFDGPMAVLINRFSASASEIFAGAIQDYQRGVVIGEQTFGKGTVQSVIDLSRYIKVPDGEKVGQLKLTLQKFYRVTGSSTQHLGVSPDVNLPSAFEADEFGESSNLSALPWDQIKGTKFNMTKDVSRQLLARLNDGYSQRLKNNADLKELVAETSELKANLSKTIISLNEKERKAEMAQAEKRRNERQANNLSGTIDKENRKKTDSIEEDDQYLKEGIIILTQVIGAFG